MKLLVNVLFLVIVVLFTVHTIGCSSSDDTKEASGPHVSINTEKTGDGTDVISELAQSSFKVTDTTFTELVLEAESPVVVDFGADWCPPCQWMDPIVEKAASENRGIFLVAKLDVDKNPQTTGKYRINSLPTFIVFQDGKVIDRFVGVIPKTRFVQQILDAINVQGN